MNEEKSELIFYYQSVGLKYIVLMALAVAVVLGVIVVIAKRRKRTGR